MSTRPETPDFVERAPIRAVAEREVGATPDRVFEVLADAPSWERWFPNMKRCRWLTEPPHGVGSRRRVRVGPLEVTEEFVLWEPGQVWGFTFLDVNLPGAKAGVERVDLTPVGDDRCHVRYTMAIEPLPVLSLLGGPFKVGAEKGLRDGLKGLDTYVSRA